MRTKAIVPIIESQIISSFKLSLSNLLTDSMLADGDFLESVGFITTLSLYLFSPPILTSAQCANIASEMPEFGELSLDPSSQAA